MTGSCTFATKSQVATLDWTCHPDSPPTGKNGSCVFGLCVVPSEGNLYCDYNARGWKQLDTLENKDDGSICKAFISRGPCTVEVRLTYNLSRKTPPEGITKLISGVRIGARRGGWRSTDNGLEAKFRTFMEKFDENGLVKPSQANDTLYGST